MKVLKNLALVIVFAMTLHLAAFTGYASSGLPSLSAEENQAIQTSDSPTILPLDTRADQIEVQTQPNAEVMITITGPESQFFSTSDKADQSGWYELSIQKLSLEVTNNNKLIAGSVVTAKAKEEGKAWSDPVSVTVAQEPAVNGRAFNVRVSYENGNMVTGLNASVFKITNASQGDITKNFTFNDLGSGLYQFIAKTAPEGFAVPQLPTSDVFTVNLDLSKDPELKNYGQKEAGKVTIYKGKPVETPNIVIKLENPDFEIRVLNENFEPVYDRLVQLVKLQVDKDGKAQLVGGNYKPVGYAFWSAITRQGQTIGVNSDFLHPVAGSDNTGLYYFGKTDSYVKAGDQFGIRVYSSDSDEVSANLPLTYRLIEPWDRSGNVIAPALKGKVDVVSNPKTNVTLNLTFVEDGPAKKPISGLKAQLEQDVSAALAPETYIDRDQAKTTGLDGKLSWTGLTLDRGTLKEDPVTKKKVVVLPLRLQLEALPKGLDPNLKTIQLEVLQEALKGKTTINLEIALTTNSLVRSAGDNRYDTALLSAKLAYPQGVKAADGFYDLLLASGESFPDALAAAPLAGAYDGPVLLTAKDGLPQNVKAYIQALKDKASVDKNKIRITLVGGQGTISESVYNAIEAMDLKVERLAGPNRIATSLEIAKKVMNNLPAAGEKKVVLASQASFADALAVSPLAADKHYPIILTAKDALTNDVREALAQWKPTKVYVIGGTASISEALVDTLGLDGLQIETERISGANRYKTATAIAQTFYGDTRSAFVASGTSFPDALSGAIAAMKAKSPILLVGSDSNHEDAVNYIKDNGIGHITILGGVKTVTPETEKAIKKVIGLTVE